MEKPWPLASCSVAFPTQKHFIFLSSPFKFKNLTALELVKIIPLNLERSISSCRVFLIDNKGEKIETVVLGKALSLLKKHIDLNRSYFWVVYPKNKNTQHLHLQVAGIWDPYQLNDFPNDSLKTNFSKLLEELGLKDNYFSVRGELVYVNTQKKRNCY